MKTIRRLQSLNLPEDETDDDDLMVELRRHVENRQKELRKLRPNGNVDPTFVPEMNKFVSKEYGLTPAANNALIVGKFMGHVAVLSKSEFHVKLTTT